MPFGSTTSQIARAVADSPPTWRQGRAACRNQASRPPSILTTKPPEDKPATGPTSIQLVRAHMPGAPFPLGGDRRACAVFSSPPTRNGCLPPGFHPIGFTAYTSSLDLEDLFDLGRPLDSYKESDLRTGGVTRGPSGWHDDAAWSSHSHSNSSEAPGASRQTPSSRGPARCSR